MSLAPAKSDGLLEHYHRKLGAWAMIAKLKYLSQEKSGLCLYCRQISADLRHHYEGRILRRQSLGTHDPAFAAKEALRLGALDDQIWQALRNGAYDIEAARASIPQTGGLDVIRRIMKEKAGPRLTDALATYVKKHQGRDARFFQNANRAFATVSNSGGLLAPCFWVSIRCSCCRYHISVEPPSVT